MLNRTSMLAIAIAAFGLAAACPANANVLQVNKPANGATAPSPRMSQKRRNPNHQPACQPGHRS